MLQTTINIHATFNFLVQKQHRLNFSFGIPPILTIQIDSCLKIMITYLLKIIIIIFQSLTATDSDINQELSGIIHRL